MKAWISPFQYQPTFRGQPFGKPFRTLVKLTDNQVEKVEDEFRRKHKKYLQIIYIGIGK